MAGATEKSVKEAKDAAERKANELAAEAENAAREAKDAAERKEIELADAAAKAAGDAKAAEERYRAEANFRAQRDQRNSDCLSQGILSPNAHINYQCVIRNENRYRRDLDAYNDKHAFKPIKPCPENEFKNTGYNEEGSGSIWYLDRHVMDCGLNSFISSFKLERWGGQMRYKYKCIESDSDNIDQCYSASTPFNDIGEDDKHSSNFLNRHNVVCNDGYGLQKVKLQRENNKLGYVYTCCSGALECSNSETTTEDQGSGETFFLDRLFVKAGFNKVLSGFKLDTLKDNKWRYKLKSCKIQGNLKQTFDTVCQDASGGDIFFLDRQHVKCGFNSAISRFKLERPTESGDKIKYDYTCVYSQDDISNNCVNYETNRDDTDPNSKNSAAYLDRHQLSCPADRVLRSFGQKRDGNRIYFTFTCCGANVATRTDVETLGKDGGGETYFLEKHNVDAGGFNVIGGFKLLTGKSWRYQQSIVSLASHKAYPVSKRDTGFNDEDGGTIWFLDRHDIKCENNQFINNFKLVRSNDNKMRYDYSCVSYKTNSQSCYSKSTAAQDVASNRKEAINWLDRHNIQCDDEFALQRFKLSREGDKVKYDYTCCKGAMSCIDTETSAEDKGNNNTAYLDRLFVDAKEGRAISQLKFANLPGNKMKYNFKSCKVLY